MDSHIIITDLGEGMYRLVPEPGYYMVSSITYKKHSVAITSKPDQFESRLLDTPPEPHIRTLEDAKREKLAALKAYDASPAVNSFSLGGQSMWIAPDDRANYILTLQGAKRLGVESVAFLGQTIPVDNALAMLDAVNLYAMQCVGVTEAHRAAINAKRAISTVDAYDFTGGYPEKLRF